MPRKAKNTKNTPFTAEMGEVYFRTIQADFISLREEMNSKFEAIYRRFEKVNKRFDQVDKRFEKIEGVLRTILKLNQKDKLEREEIKLNLWEHNRHITKLQKQLAKI